MYNQTTQNIQNFKKSLYSIQEKEEILNIFKKNIDKCSQKAKQQMIDILHPRIYNQEEIDTDNIEQRVANLKFYNTFLSNTNIVDNSIYDFNCFKVIPKIYKVNRLIYFQAHYLNESHTIENGNGYVQFTKSYKNNAKKFLQMNLTYKYRGNLTLILDINGKTTQYSLTESDDFIIKKINENIEQIESLSVKIILISHTNSLLTIKNIQVNLTDEI